MDTTTPTRYAPDTTLRIREHLPPEPFRANSDYKPSPRPDADWSCWDPDAYEITNLTEFALANPPVETESPGKTERTLTITGTKTRRQSRGCAPERGGAHVVTCFLDGDSSVEYIAKIYDGVDYPTDMETWDCMSRADEDYAVEAWAYRGMQSVIGGTVVPAYFGSWTFPLDTNHNNRQRWVRMILLELIQGECLADIMKRAETGAAPPAAPVDYSLLPPDDFRLRVLRSVIDSKLAVWWEGLLDHNDLEPRNIMVRPDGSVAIIDFNHVTLYEFTIYGREHPRQLLDPAALPESPIQKYWPVPFGSVARGYEKSRVWGRWVPESWLGDLDLATEWLVETWRGSAKYAPLEQGWLDWTFHDRNSVRSKGCRFAGKPRAQAG
ncbi:uncharacterized protein B0H64DRAFT_413585 [Chaetomium fimeti]|uniref:Uncharacterized protein n=1 Tax=Chaetomium fimeti TaxID=1854472 RepID=A0AAE0H569_9PEZI|nr:hypothetical protein B0H64DRAFT_413585 [Chaetomium fimeti]